MREARRLALICTAAGLFAAAALSPTGGPAAVAHQAAPVEPENALPAAPAPGGNRGPLRVQAGDDVQSAIDATPSGGTIVMAAGEHRGPITISHRISLRGEEGARLEGGRQGAVVTIEADGVVVEDLEIRGSGFALSQDDAGVLVTGNGVRLANLRLRENLHGIYVRRGTSVALIANHVVGLAADGHLPGVAGAAEMQREDAFHHAPPRTGSLIGNGIHLFDADGARVERNHIQHVRDGIYVAHTTRAVFRENRVHDSRYGIHYMYSSDNLITGNELWRNVAGPALMFSRNIEVTGNLLRDHSGFRAYGLLLQNVDASHFRGNEIRGNRVGIRLQHSSDNELVSNRLSGNVAGLALDASSRDNAFTRNVIGVNLRQVELSGRVPPTRWAVEGVGNRWHDALPLDLSGDGIAEWPHHEVDLMAGRREELALVQLLSGSAGIRALEWALRRAPVPGMRFITDPHPLTRERL
jgi:nitrous oxidase accessory protein